MKKRLLTLILSVLLMTALTANALTIPNGTITPGTNDSDLPANAEYTNGLYLQGAQVRVEDGATSMGLRFVTAVNETLLSNLAAEGATRITYGTLVSATESTPTLFNSRRVVAKKTYRSSETLGGDYKKFTAVVVGIPSENFGYQKNIIYVRPYIEYYLEGEQRYMYGEIYSSNLYDVAKTAYNSGKETTAVKNYLLENILRVTYDEFPNEDIYTGGIYKP